MVGGNGLVYSMCFAVGINVGRRILGGKDLTPHFARFFYVLMVDVIFLMFCWVA
jgi:hypothetical protein